MHVALPTSLEDVGTMVLISALLILGFMVIRLRMHIETALLGKMLRNMPNKIEGKTKRRLLRWMTLEIRWIRHLLAKTETEEDRKQFSDLTIWLSKVKNDIYNDCHEEEDIKVIRAMISK